jgi:hypothetical protein
VEMVFLCFGPLVIFGGILIYLVWIGRKSNQQELLREQIKTANMSPEEKEQYFENKRRERERSEALASFGPLSRALICPHCQTKGQVRTKKITQKKGISGGKATGAVLTGGLSLLATGLSRKEAATQAHCDKCNSTWHF